MAPSKRVLPGTVPVGNNTSQKEEVIVAICDVGIRMFVVVSSTFSYIVILQFGFTKSVRMRGHLSGHATSNVAAVSVCHVYLLHAIGEGCFLHK